MTGTTITLTKPIKTHAGETTALTLREATAGDVFDFGAPISVVITGQTADNPSGDKRIEMRYGTIRKYLERLTGVDEGLLRQLSIRDMNRLASRIVAMVSPDTGEDADAAGN